MPKTRAPYRAEFRAEMVRLVRAGRTPGELSREFEPSDQTIRNWVNQADVDEGRREGLTTAEREEGVGVVAVEVMPPGIPRAARELQTLRTTVGYPMGGRTVSVIRIGCRVGVRVEAGDTLWSGQVATARPQRAERPTHPISLGNGRPLSSNGHEPRL